MPPIPAKNNFKNNILAFLTQKFGTAGRLLGLLKILRDMKPAREIDETIDILQNFNMEEVPADERSILRKMRLCNAT